MAIERSLIILKPDATAKGIEYEILDKFTKKGLTVSNLYKVNASEKILREHYAAVIKEKGDQIGDTIIRTMMEGPVIVAIIEGNQAVEAVRIMAGEKTEPLKCSPGTIRYIYSTDSFEMAVASNRAVNNIIHSSDSRQSAEREISLWFGNYSNGTSKEQTRFGEIANTIGYTLPSLIEDLVKLSNNERVLYHGIKDSKDVRLIVNKGIEPLTPESGPCSFWSTGIGLFKPEQDSAFFAYSGRHSLENLCEMNIALSTYSILEKTKGMQLPVYEPDTNITIAQTVPYDAIALLSVELKHPITNDNAQLRKYSQRAEQLMLNLISSQLYGNFSRGNHIKIIEEMK